MDILGTVQAMQVIGNVSGKTAVLLDDMVDTAGPLCNGAEILMQAYINVGSLANS